MSSVENPGVPRSTRKPPISPSSSLAQTTATSATEPLVIQSLVPLRTYAPPSRRARVFIPPGSEPWSGSVRPKQPTRAPVARRSEEHTSELQSPCNLVCRLLLEKKKKQNMEHGYASRKRRG